MGIDHKPFYFIRHGETDWNRNRIYMGSKDIPLNALGIKQAEDAALWIEKEPIKYIVTSPLIRAAKTAEIIATALKKPIVVIDELRERSLGVKEGGRFEEQWPEDGSEGLEKYDDFEARVIGGLQKAFELSEPTLIVSHGGVYHAIQKALGWPLIDLKNCSINFHRPPKKQEDQWFICPLNNDEI